MRWFDETCDARRRHLERSQGQTDKGRAKPISLVRDAVRDAIPALAAGAHGGSIDKETIEEVTEQLRKASPDVRVLVRAQAFFGEVIFRAVKEYGWTSPPVPQLTVIRRESSPYRSQTAHFRQRYRDLEAAFWRSVEQIDSLPPEMQVAQVVLSLILYGALVNPAELNELLARGDIRVRGLNSRAWVELVPDPRKAVPGMAHRLYADDVSHLLLRRLSRTQGGDSRRCRAGGRIRVPGGGWTEKAFLKTIRDLLRDAGATHGLPDSLPQLLAFVQADMAVQIPPYLIQYASGHNPSYSLPLDVMGRTALEDGWEMLEPGLDDALGEEGAASTDPPPALRLAGPELRALGAVEDAVARKSVAEARATFEENLQHLSPTSRHVAAWYVAMRAGTGPTRRASTGSSVQNRFRLGRELVALSQGHDLARLSERDLEVLYDDVLGRRTTPASASDASKALLQFHAFLRTQCESVPEVDFTELDHYMAARHQVNVNVVTGREYKALLCTLWDGRGPAGRLDQARYLMAVLGYRLGMRRQEIRYLRLADICCLRTTAYLELVETEDRALKSASSGRLFHLHDLLDAAELSALRRWVAHRERESSDSEAYLFAGADGGPLSRDSTVDRVRAILREVTGDSNLKFHSLRHSFGTYLLLRTEANAIARTTGDFEPPPWDPSYEHEYGKTRFLDLLDGTEPSRKLLYQTAILLGHSSPRMTLLHYTHACDWLLHQWQRTRIPQVSTAALGRLLDRKKTSMASVLRAAGRSGEKQHKVARYKEHARGGWMPQDWTLR